MRLSTLTTLPILRQLIMFGTLIPLMWMLGACGGTSGLDPEQVPVAVRNAFAARYPGNTPRWEAQSYGYEAIFTQDGVEHEAEFAHNGQWLETEYEVSENQFSSLVLDRVRREYPGYAITKREIELTPQGTFYEVEIEWGGTEYELYFDERANPTRNANEDA